MTLPLSETINALEGRTYTRNGEVLTVEKVQIADHVVTIYTTAGVFEKHEDQMPGFLKSLQPSSEVPVRAMPKKPAPVATAPAAPTVNSSLQIMQQMLLTALEKVQDGGANLDEARTVSKLVQTGINLARLELEAVKMSRA